jgi:hypothetical protein
MNNIFSFFTHNPQLTQIGWAVTLVMAALAVLLLLYGLLLSLWPTGERQPRQPKAPLMPTKPNLAAQSKADVPLRGARMVIMAGVAGGGDIPLPADKFIIGRYYHPESGVLVALDERSISRRHAQFVGDDERREYYLTDLQSSYGTALHRPTGLVPLTPGTRMRVYNEDLVQFGQVVVVKLVLPGEPRPFEPVPAQLTSSYGRGQS